MNRHLTFSLAISLTLGTQAVPLRAANNPRAETNSRNPVVWTNDNLEKVHRLSQISIVGRMDEEQPASASAPAPYVETQDPEWYAEQAAQLRDELQRRRVSSMNTRRRWKMREVSGRRRTE